ncbi:hypothetical protein [Gilliamella apicola]|uniref:hypothetical protein n=1 Tax=Gilliamella apicola TaxID=1196095 RepID=UPI002FEDF368
MKLTRCPICHNEINLEALVEDDSGRELLMLVSNLSYGCAKPMIAYIGLFRTQKSNLSNSRAVNLINDVLQLFQPSRHLAHALRETVNNIHAKRLTSDYKPFKNHNYLKSVYESTKHLFVYVEHKEDKPVRSSNEEYFEQMYRAGVDFNKLEKNIPGALDWYKKKTGA